MKIAIYIFYFKDFINFVALSTDALSTCFSQSTKNRSAHIIGLEWILNSQILYITNQVCIYPTICSVFVFRKPVFLQPKIPVNNRLIHSHFSKYMRIYFSLIVITVTQFFQGLELYQVNPEKKSIKLLKSYNISLYWYLYYVSSNICILDFFWIYFIYF